MLSLSRVVHTSIDPGIDAATPTAPAASGDEAGGAAGEDQDPDRVITNARSARPEDGLLGSEGLVSLFSELPRATSSYALGLSRYLDGEGELQRGQEFPIFGITHSLSPSTLGFFEPAFTSYTHYWKSVLGEFIPLGCTHTCLLVHTDPQIIFLCSLPNLQASK
jgi:RNA exonuclease NGL2